MNKVTVTYTDEFGSTSMVSLEMKTPLNAADLADWFCNQGLQGLGFPQKKED